MRFSLLLTALLAFFFSCKKCEEEPTIYASTNPLFEYIGLNTIGGYSFFYDSVRNRVDTVKLDRIDTVINQWGEEPCGLTETYVDYHYIYSTNQNSIIDSMSIKLLATNNTCVYKINNYVITIKIYDRDSVSLNVYNNTLSWGNSLYKKVLYSDTVSASLSKNEESFLITIIKNTGLSQLKKKSIDDTINMSRL